MLMYVPIVYVFLPEINVFVFVFVYKFVLLHIYEVYYYEVHEVYYYMCQWTF